MAIFWKIFLKTTAIFFSIVSLLILLTLILGFFESRNNEEFSFISGDKDSSNTIAIIELSGLIIEKNTGISEFTNPYIISPLQIKKTLDNLKNISPNIIIFSINSPGGTVSASRNLYEIIKNFKSNNETEIYFHTNELLTSGAYWISTAADSIYANYGSIIGSIGVKGPDWFFYDKPTSISYGILGSQIETKEDIKVYSSKAGKSKDIFNPFRKPSDNELIHLQNMVDEIYNDFVQIVSKERKIEIESIINDIGALIYTSKKANELHLIDDELNLEDLIKKIIKDKKFINYKILKKYNKKNSLIKEILSSNYNKSNLDMNYDCLSLRSSISSVLNYESLGC